MSDDKTQAAIQRYNAAIVAAVAALEQIARDLLALEQQNARLQQARQEAITAKVRAQAALEAIQQLSE